MDKNDLCTLDEESDAQRGGLFPRSYNLKVISPGLNSIRSSFKTQCSFPYDLKQQDAEKQGTFQWSLLFDFQTLEMLPGSDRTYSIRPLGAHGRQGVARGQGPGIDLCGLQLVGNSLEVREKEKNTDAWMPSTGTVPGAKDTKMEESQSQCSRISLVGGNSVM